MQVMIGGLYGAARQATARKLADLHFGLGVERDAECCRFAGGLGVDAAQVVEEGVRLGEFF